MTLDTPSPAVAGLDYGASYWNYLRSYCPSLSSEAESQVTQQLGQTSWEDPQTGLDWNNCGVVALIEASRSNDLSDREIYLEMAISAFEQGIEQHPLCQAHLSLVYALIGDSSKAIQTAFSYLLVLLQIEHGPNPREPLPGLLWLPPSPQPPKATQEQLLTKLLAATGYRQCQLLLGEILLRAHMVFYNSTGLRFLHLASQLAPDLAAINLRLGISSLTNAQREGMLYLHRAAGAAPGDFAVCTALAVAYQDVGQMQLAQYWQVKAQGNAVMPEPASGENIYVPYDELWIAVEPSFRSIVTAVLIAEGDWFERELEFWRSRIQPGMVVIDVGANVGVYTFSAARRVGSGGRVIAVEPFSGCVQRLESTCKHNQLSQVTVYRGAASDHEGEIYLSLAAASELNEVVTDSQKLGQGNYEQAPCFTLDYLCKQEQLSRVDFLKIDAEGHELQVLLGAQQLIERFSPVILYENIAGQQGSNLEVAEYLQKLGYQLFCYRPYVQQLVPIEVAVDFQGSLNLIAIHPN